MLKIQRVADGPYVVFTLSGRIEGDLVAELQRLFALEADGHSLVLDLQEVTLVDRDAIGFLALCEAAGATLKHCPAYIHEWIARARTQQWAVSNR